MWFKKDKLEPFNNEKEFLKKENFINETEILSIVTNSKIATDKLNNRIEEITYITDSISLAIEKLKKFAISNIDFTDSIKSQFDDQKNNYRDTSESILRLKKMSEETLVSVEDGALKVKENISFISEIINQMDNVNESIKSLTKETVDISKTIEKIEDITDTVNILSVNAALEANKAGEYGKGFSVIADEIKKLSADISGLSSNILSRLSNINEKNDITFEAIECGKKLLNEGEKISKDITSNFDKIKKDTEETFLDINNIVEKFNVVNEKLDENSKKTLEINNLSLNVLNSIEFEIMNISYVEQSIANLTVVKNTYLDLVSALKAKIKDLEEVVNDKIIKLFVKLPVKYKDPWDLNVVDEMQVYSNIHSALLKMSNSGFIIPGIIKYWELSEDNRTWIFTIRNDVYFHDGSLLTIEDILFSINKLANSTKGDNIKFIKNFGGIEELAIKKIDNNSFSITLSIPDGSFLNKLTYITGAIVSKKKYELGEIIGCGAYRIIECNKNNEISKLKRFDKYFAGKAFLENIEINSVYNLEEHLEQAKENEYFIINQNACEEEVLIKAKNHNFTNESFKNLEKCGMMINFRKKNMLQYSEIIRKAIWMSLDRKKLSSIMNKGDATLGNSGFRHNYFQGPNRKNNYTLEDGINLLKKNNMYPVNKKLTTATITKFERFVHATEEVKSTLEKLGFEIEVVYYDDLKEFMNSHGLYDFLVLVHASDDTDMLNYLELIYPNGEETFGFEDIELKEKWDNYSQTVNPYERAREFENIENELYEKLPFIPICFTDYKYLYSKELKGVKVNCYGVTLLEDIYIRE